MTFDHFPFCVYLSPQELCLHPAGQAPSLASGFLLPDPPPEEKTTGILFTDLAFSLPLSPSVPESLGWTSFSSTYWFGRFPILSHFLITG